MVAEDRNVPSAAVTRRSVKRQLHLTFHLASHLSNGNVAGIRKKPRPVISIVDQLHLSACLVNVVKYDICVSVSLTARAGLNSWSWLFEKLLQKDCMVPSLYASVNCGR